jgi:hypothetical protein
MNPGTSCSALQISVAGHQTQQHEYNAVMEKRPFQFTLWRMLYATLLFCVPVWCVAMMQQHRMYGAWIWLFGAFVAAGIRAIIAHPPSDAKSVAARQRWIYWCAFLTTSALAIIWLPICWLPPGTNCRPMGQAMLTLGLLVAAAAGIVKGSDQIVATWPKPWNGIIGISVSLVPVFAHVLLMWLVLDVCGIVFED